MSAVTDRAELLLGDIQPEVADDPIVQMAFQAVANELDRFEETATALRDGFFPSTATSQSLALYEAEFGLPVSPALPLETRRELVLAHFRKRLSGAGLDWEAALAKAMGTAFSYTEGPGPYQVTVRYAFGAGTPTSTAVQQFAREITPAHLSVLATYSSGFLVGISFVGDPL